MDIDRRACRPVVASGHGRLDRVERSAIDHGLVHVGCDCDCRWNRDDHSLDDRLSRCLREI